MKSQENYRNKTISRSKTFIFSSKIIIIKKNDKTLIKIFDNI